ncbi:sigma-70 family RNA polymerase sigma factor [Kitasatospora sp. NPDC050463]|uniref:RNA polymerase sigma factor n=1 Tax=Kitasatospora sp. NPDC050463 TaxID=3155786 RepID=UPI0033F9CB50
MERSEKVEPYQSATIDEGLPNWAQQAREDGKLYARARYLTGNPDDADDLIQETYEKVWKARAPIKPIDNPVAYLRTALSRLHIDWLRKKRVRPYEVQVDDLQDFDKACEGVETQIDLCDEEVRQALQSLGARERHLAILVDIEGYTVKAAAEELRMSYTMAHKYHQMATKQLRTALAHRDWKLKEGRHELE